MILYASKNTFQQKEFDPIIHNWNDCGIGKRIKNRVEFNTWNEALDYLDEKDAPRKLRWPRVLFMCDACRKSGPREIVTLKVTVPAGRIPTSGSKKNDGESFVYSIDEFEVLDRELV